MQLLQTYDVGLFVQVAFSVTGLPAAGASLEALTVHDGTGVGSASHVTLKLAAGPEPALLLAVTV